MTEAKGAIVIAVVSALAAVAPLGCDDRQAAVPAGGGASSRPGTATRPGPTTAPARAADDGEVMAYVNGTPIPMGKLIDVLVRNYGMPLAHQFVATELVRQAAAREGITVTDDDVRAENARTLEQMFGDVDDPAQTEQLLQQLLAQKNYSRQQWDMTMQRQAILRAMAGKRAVIDPAELQREFGEQYGRKYVVRHIQLASAAEAARIKKLAEAPGADFPALARRHSKNASARNGGLLPPIGSQAAGLPPDLRKVARAMKTVGEISDLIQVGTAFHILRLEKIIEPKDVKFADVREELAEVVRERQIEVLRQQLLTELIRNAKIEYVHPVLKAKAARGPTE